MKACDDCQGPLAIPADGSYDPTVLYERIHTVECVELNRDQAIPLKRPEVVEEDKDEQPTD